MSNQMDEAVKSTPISIEQDLMEPELKMAVEPKLTDDGGQGEDEDEKVSMQKNTCTRKEGPSSIVQTSSSADLFDINNCFNYPEIMDHVDPDSDLQRIPFSVRLSTDPIPTYTLQLRHNDQPTFLSSNSTRTLKQPHLFPSE